MAALFGAVLAVACGLCLHSFRFAAGLRQLSYDLLLVSRGGKAAREAVIVYLDEQSYIQLQQPLNAPWDRALHARLLDRLTKAGAKMVVFDVVFSDTNRANPAGDRILADAMKTNGSVVLAADCISAGPKSREFIVPFDLLFDSAAGIGSAEMKPDRDLTVRQHTLKDPDDQVSIMSWVAAQVAKAPVTLDPKAELKGRWINYYGPPGTIDGVSYFRALDQTLVGDDFFRGKVVFVGARIQTKFTGERKDEYRNPFSVFESVESVGGRSTLFMPGVEIQATAFLNLLRGDWLQRFPWRAESWTFAILGAGFGIVLILLRPLPAVGVALVGITLVASASSFLMRQELIWFPWLIGCVQISAALSWSVLFNSVQLYVEKRLYQQTLASYLSPKLVKKFSRNANLLKVGAEKQELTLVFTDIADFTSISDGLETNALEKMMNEYFQVCVTECIHPCDGTVVKFIGDAIFSFWNAPELQEDHAFRACEAALHFRKVKVKSPDGRLLHTRIGIHSGEANVGNFGSEDRFDYTALGENVNLASRLEGLNKHLGTVSLISGATRAEIGDRLVTRAVGNFQLKGFEKPVEIFELVGWPEEAEASRKWRESFEQALENYKSGDFELAMMGFRQTLALRPDDGPTHYYIGRIEEIGKEPLVGDWTGATIMKEK